MRSGVRTSWLLLSLLAAAAPAFAQRGTNFHRVTTSRREAYSGPPRSDRASAAYAETAARGVGPNDPLQPYTSTPMAIPGTPSAYAPGDRPRATAPEREARRSYFPTMRTGQGPNRNVAAGRRGGRCTPGRAGFLAGGVMSLGGAQAIPAPSPGMPRR
ncbi:MAG: hypothetical protein U0790_21030 [Isosphaeraceae bacterium]